ncbi:MAG: RibD family protein [Acidobacteria bacterium]|nr:RibD family protein [Acidobacteriota bacterium]
MHHHPKPAVSLQVYPSGEWEASAVPTAAARQVLDLYLPLQLRADLVIAQAGQSLDGRIATPAGHSHYVTGPADIRRLHRLRALVDAVVVGAGTVAADNPRLTVREVEGPNPVRVVIDPRGRLDASSAVFRDGAAPTIAVRSGGTAAAAACAARAPDDGPTIGGGLPAGQRRAGNEPSACEVVAIPAAPTGELAPRDILRALRERGHRRLLIEGGGVTVSRFLDARVVDRLHVAVAPLVIGSGPAAFALAPIRTLDEALRPACRIFRLGADVLFDLDLAQARGRPGGRVGSLAGTAGISGAETTGSRTEGEPADPGDRR